MSEKRYLYSNKKKKSKKPAIIIISIIAVIAIIIAVAILLFQTLGGSSNNLPFATNPSITEHTQETTQVTVSEQPTTEKTENITSNTEQNASTQNPDSEESSDIQKTTDESITMQSSNSESVVVPGDVDDATYFSATYSPYKAVDSETNEQCSLKEVFGSSYGGGGSVTFNSDGSFSDTLTTSSSNKGSYAVKDSKLIATYSNDRNMDVSVSSWNGDTPSEIIINYGGYYVYLS